MTTDTKSVPATKSSSLIEDGAVLWRSLPDKPVLFVLLGAWILLFQFTGNSTFGYVRSVSLFGWWTQTLSWIGVEDHAYLMPFVTVALLMWKGPALAALPKKICWPVLGLLVLALLFHVLGYVVQQTRVSLLAFVFGVYVLTGVVWGWRWMVATLFPFSLLVFCMPMGEGIEGLTFPLRLLATQITSGFCHTVLGIPVIRVGTQLFSPDGRFQYEVAAACSGINSLTATIVFAVVFGYIALNSFGRRLLLVISAVPFAVLGNVIRLTTIVMAGQLFGQEAGNFVHENWFFSLSPYIPAIGGLLLLGRWLDPGRTRLRPPPPMDAPVLPQPETRREA